MTRHPDPIVRRILVQDRAQVRIMRRVVAVFAYIDAHPEATRGNDAALRRLDDLLGEADRLWRAL